MSITLAQLRTQARQRADMEQSNFITDSELNGYINHSIAELHDLLVQSYGEDYFIEEETFSTVANQDSYSISTIIPDQNFYKLRGVDAKLNGAEWFTLQPFTFNERNRRQTSGTWRYLGISSVRYRLVGSNLRFSPAPDSSMEVRLWYIPTATVLSSDADTLDDLNQFAEYVIVDAAIKMMQKEESDTVVLERQKAALKRRIEEAAGNRDAGFGESISDIYSENNEYFFGRTLN